MKTNSQYQKKIFKKIIIAILTLLCLTSLIWFISTFKQLYKEGNLGVNYSITGRPTHLHHSATVNTIENWMTFNYINVVFKLNPLYLKNTLSIDDSKYPNIRIDSYAKHHNLNLQLFLHNIEQTIINYPYNK